MLHGGNNFMKFVTWNVNGLRAIVKKDFEKNFSKLDADIFCLQETKLQKGQIPLDFDSLGYDNFWNFAIQKGYSGVATLIKKDFAKKRLVDTKCGFGIEEHNKEGRVIVNEFDSFFFVNSYVPNAQPELKRLDYRMKWEDDLLKFLKLLDNVKPVIWCGDLNVAHKEIDLKNPKTNHGNPGFSDEERAKMSKVLASGFVDSFRYLYPEKVQYTWWSYRQNARENNTGWRIDYFIVSDRIKDKIKDVVLHNEIYGSDHCPVELIIDV